MLTCWAGNDTVEMPIPQPSIGSEAKALIELTNSAEINKVCASSAADDILEIEGQKLEMTKQLMAMRRIELSARPKSHQYAGIDVDEMFSYVCVRMIIEFYYFYPKN